jgi:hypothetical protein
MAGPALLFFQYYSPVPTGQYNRLLVTLFIIVIVQ